MRWRAIVLLVVLFLAVLIARWPASALARQFPAPLACQDVRGTLWHGECGAMTVQGHVLGSLAWDLKLLPLLTGQAATDLRLQGPGLSVTTRLMLRRDQSARINNLVGDVQLATIAPSLRAFGVRVPAGFAGQVSARLDEVRISPGGLMALVRGDLQVRDLAQAPAPQLLGSWSLSFDGHLSAANEPVGQLADRGGPFDCVGTLRLTAGPGYVVEGAIAPRAEVSPEVLGALRYMGSPDAAGRRPFELTGNF